MKKICAILAILAIFFSMSGQSYAKEERQILREGLLGAGAGAVGGLASGAKGGDVWKGALAGAGVNIVGGVLLDAISGEKVGTVDNVKAMDAQDAYKEGYKDGYENGYKQGFTSGYKEGTKEAKGQ